MLSLVFFIAVQLLLLLALAWAASWGARVVDSTRGQFKWGLVVVLATAAIGAVGLFISRSLEGESSRDALLLAVIVLLVWLGAIFFVTTRVFRLSTKRTFAPLAAQLATYLFAIGVLALVIRPFLFEMFVIPTRSMGPTLEPQDRIAVCKVLAPQRWDIVVYNFKFHWPHESSVNFCKRLIGLPGERLRFENGDLYVDDQKVEPPAILAGRLRAEIADGPPGDFHYRDGETISLGPDEYFFIGDDVDESRDSRMDGPSHRDSLIGVADWLYWPLSKFRILR